VGAGAFQDNVIAVDFVNQQPVGLNMTIPVTRPITGQGMVTTAWGEGLFFGQKGHHLPEFSQIKSPFFDALDIPQKSRGLLNGPDLHG
jgi:hypothetical protein